MMKIAVACNTFDVFRTGRRDLLMDTLASIPREQCHSFTLLTCGSSDQTDMLVAELGGIVDNGGSKAWYGMQRCIEHALATEPDIVVLSADDIEYHPGWLSRLVSFWQAAPDNVKLASLFIENYDYPWATVNEAVEIGGERVLMRESVPGASWSFRARDVHLILPIPELSPGEDLARCRILRQQGYRLAQLDLATHAGERQSAWQNMSWAQHPPLDRQKWGL